MKHTLQAFMPLGDTSFPLESTLPHLVERRGSGTTLFGGLLRGFLIFTLLILSNDVRLNAQDNLRIPIIEHFTNTYCIICANRNPALHEAREEFGSTVHHITFYPSVPYSQCPLYNYNRIDNGARESYYNIPATPRIIVDGQAVSTSASSLKSAVEGRQSLQTPITIDVSEEDDGRTKNVMVTLNGKGPSETSDYRLFVALVEKQLSFSAQNGEREHFNVFRKMISDKDGDRINLPVAGESSTFSYSTEIEDDLILEEMYVVAYVQDASSSDVLNSGSKLTTMTTSAEDGPVAGVSIFPNPAVGNLQVRSTPGVVKYALYNLIGHRLITQDLPLPQTNLNVSLAGIASGTYIIEVNHTDRSRNRKLVFVR